MSQLENIAIIGAGGLGKEIAVLINQINQDRLQWKIIGFFDDGIPAGTQVLSLPVLGKISELPAYSCRVVMAIGDPVVKAAIIGKIADTGISFATLIHPRAVIGDTITVGAGTIICAGSVLTADTVIGKHVLVNLNSTVGHDVTIGDYTSLMPGVHVSGYVAIGDRSFLGTGSSVLQHVRIDSDTVIGAGAVVNRDVQRHTTVVGVPAREILRKL